MKSITWVFPLLLLGFYNYLSGAIMKGTVMTSPESLPVVNSYILIANGVDFVGDSIIYDAYSSEDGSYLIEDIPAGQFDVYCTHPEYESFVGLIHFTGNQEEITLNISLLPYSEPPPPPDSGFANLQGIVTDTLTGEPVYPVIISIYNDGYYADSLLNNPDGSYIFEGIIPGSYYLNCHAENYKPLYNLIVQLDPGYNQFNFQLETAEPVESGFISGKVVYDETGDPVYGAYIEFRPNDERSMIFTTTTNINGNYNAEIPVGEYIIICEYNSLILTDSISASSIYPPNNYREYYNDVRDITQATPVKIFSGETVNNVNFGIPQFPNPDIITIYGKVTDNIGNPIEQARVNFDSGIMTFAPDPTYIPDVFTDANGSYLVTFNNIMYEYLYAYAEKQGYNLEYYKEKKTFDQANPILLTDLVITNIDFTLDLIDDSSGVYSISGTVYSDSGAAISGAFIIGVNVDNFELIITFSTNNGYYHLNNLKPGNYYLLFAANSHMYEFYNNVFTWEEANPVKVTDHVTGIDAALTPICYEGPIVKIIKGKVTDLSNQPLSGSIVSIRDKSGKALGCAMTNGEGDYQVMLPYFNESDILASKINYKSDTKNLKSQQDENIYIINFSLFESATPIESLNQSNFPVDFTLDAPYPNPFNPSTTISFSVPEAQPVKIAVYNILGQLVTVLLDNVIQQGTHQVSWDGNDVKGKRVASGVYFLSFETRSKKLFRKLMFNK